MPEQIHLLDKRVNLYQPENGFRTSLDAVMLAAACPARSGQAVLDAGCGVGGAAYCLAARVPGLAITGVDVQRDNVDLAEGTRSLNPDLDAEFSFACEDIRSYGRSREGVFDQVICNPPYMESGAHVASPQANTAAARGHVDDEMGLKDWLKTCHRLLRPNACLTLIHRADRLNDIVTELDKRYGRLEIIPLWPRAGEAARRVIVRALKDRKSPPVLHAGLVLHDSEGHYTPEADKVLKSGQSLFINNA
jgi:tRNA1(Val) A37 N6-methylase TrmN6